MKLDYINWYLVELKNHLSGRVSSEQEFSLAAQTRNHLESATLELELQGLDSESAQRVSIERFGNPSRIARVYIEQILRPTKPIHWVFALAFWLLFVLLIVVGLLSGLVNSTDTAAGLIAGVIVLTTIASLAIGRQLRSRFWGSAMLLALGISLPLAIPIASLKNDRRGNTSLVNQSSLAASYDRAVRQNKAITDFEDDLLKRWDGILNDSKLKNGLPPGQTLEVPELQYSGSKGVYITANMTGTETYHKFTKDDWVGLTGTDMQIGTVHPRQSQVFVGPIPYETIQKHIEETVDSINRGRVWRIRAIGILSRSLSMTYIEKVAWMALPTIAALLFIAWPISWLISSLALALRRKLSLAWRILRTA